MPDPPPLNVRRIHKIIDGFSRWSIRWAPDSMVFVLALTVVVFALAGIFTEHGPYELMHDWVKGFWGLLSFAMQMCILMITGFCVADSPVLRRGIVKFAGSFKTPGSAMMVFCLLSGIFYWLHWGAGMMASIIIGRELCARNKGLGLDYRMVAAASYCGIIFSAGLSYAPPLLVATPGHFMEKHIGVIPITETIFESHQVALTLIILLLFVSVFRVMMPPKETAAEISDELIAEFTAQTPPNGQAALTPAEKMDRSFALVAIVGAAGLIWIADFVYNNGVGELNLDVINFFFIIAGLLLHRNVHSYVASVNRGVSTVSGVITQFPFYAGIFGIIQNSGLSGIIAGWFVAVSDAHSFPWVAYVYSAVLNFFVPSGGSKFIIEIPYLAPAAQKLGSHMPYVVNAYGWGDLTTNLIQPFWALPILGAFKLKFQDILPYSALFCLLAFAACSIGICFFPLWW